MSTKKSYIDSKKSEGGNLLKVISALKMTQKSFSESILTARTTISEICSGKREIKGYQLLLIEKIHNVNQKFIKGQSDEMFLPTRLKLEPGLKKEGSDKYLNELINEKNERIKLLEGLVEGLQADKTRLLKEVDELKREIAS